MIHASIHCFYDFYYIIKNTRRSAADYAASFVIVNTMLDDDSNTSDEYDQEKK